MEGRKCKRGGRGRGSVGEGQTCIRMLLFVLVVKVEGKLNTGEGHMMLSVTPTAPTHPHATLYHTTPRHLYQHHTDTVIPHQSTSLKSARHTTPRHTVQHHTDNTSPLQSTSLHPLRHTTPGHTIQHHSTQHSTDKATPTNPHYTRFYWEALAEWAACRRGFLKDPS